MIECHVYMCIIFSLLSWSHVAGLDVLKGSAIGVLPIQMLVIASQDLQQSFVARILYAGRRNLPQSSIVAPDKICSPNVMLCDEQQTCVIHGPIDCISRVDSYDRNSCRYIWGRRPTSICLLFDHCPTIFLNHFTADRWLSSIQWARIRNLAGILLPSPYCFNNRCTVWFFGSPFTQILGQFNFRTYLHHHMCWRNLSEKYSGCKWW